MKSSPVWDTVVGAESANEPSPSARTSHRAPAHMPSPLVGKSRALVEVLRRVELVAPTDASVLIEGETGTGKELIARAIHCASARRAGPFVKINVAAIPTNLIESELFGHERGAFTGAVVRRLGRFEQAQHGTLFLDEIGELSLDLQPKLLRLLQEREFERVGGLETLKANVRLVAATNRDLRAHVEAGSFRADLFYRLNVFPIQAPPLRARREDIPELAAHFLSRAALRLGKRFDPPSRQSLAELEQYPWPGNIRELENVIERAAILSRGPTLDLELDRRTESGSMPPPTPASVAPSSHPEGDALSEVTRAHILRVLDACRWVIGGPNGAAVRLGVKRTTLNARLKKLGIVRRT